jgi:hypothetical protein
VDNSETRVLMMFMPVAKMQKKIAEILSEYVR